MQKGFLIYDKVLGCYDNESVKKYFNTQKNGKIYGIRKYKTGIPEMVKLADNAGIPRPVPGTIAKPGTNPYIAEKSIFAYFNCNGDTKEDGTPILYAKQGDQYFRFAHPDYDTCIARMPIWYRQEETDEYIDTYYSDTQHEGFKLEDAAILPDGSIRPYILMAKYPLSFDGKRYRSTSGANVAIRTISYSSLISQCNMSSGGGAFSYADYWYISSLFDLMFADYNSQKYMRGCTIYDEYINVAVAESNTKRVIVNSNFASGLVIGSSMMLGDGSSSHDRQTCFEIFDGADITKIEQYDANNSAVYLNVEEPFTTTTSSYFQSRPWRCGACDTIEGIGSPINNTDGKEPFTFQGIELAHGISEISGDIGAYNLDSTGFSILKLLDQTSASDPDSTPNYIPLGVKYISKENDFEYPKYTKTFDGAVLLSDIFGASTSTGTCDGLYLNPKESGSDREFLFFGSLDNMDIAGLHYVDLGSRPGHAAWYLGSRRSYVSRKGVNSA